MELEIHGVGYIQKLRNSDLKKSEWQKQKELLKGKANVIFDVGANRGNTTLKYLKLFPNARYIHLSRFLIHMKYLLTAIRIT